MLLQSASSTLADGEVSCTGVKTLLGAGQIKSFLGVTSVMVVLRSSPLSSMTVGVADSSLSSSVIVVPTTSSVVALLLGVLYVSSIGVDAAASSTLIIAAIVKA